jgi:hypothetical protein
MKSVGSQQFGRRSGLWTCSCGGRSDDGRSERVNEGVDCGVKIALSFVLSSYPMLLDVALYGVQCWSAVVQYRKCLLWKGKDRPKWLGSNGLAGLDSLISHPLHMPSFHLFRLMQRSVIGPELGWLISRSPGLAENACTFLNPYLPSPSLYLQRAYKQARNITTSSSSLYMYLCMELPVTLRYGRRVG